MTAVISVPRHTGTRLALSGAGIGFSVAWIVGLLIAPDSVSVGASGPEVVRTFAPHHVAALAQAILVHGAAGAALAVVVARLASGHARASAVRAAGYAAVAVSLMQCALEVVLFAHAVPAGRTALSGDLFTAVTRLDGLKMLLLAGLAVAVTAAAGTPVWLRIVGWASAISIVVSGVGYALALSGPAAAAILSLPLLLVWVTGSALSAARRTVGAAR